MDVKKSFYFDNIPAGLAMVKKEVESGRVFQVDICQGGVIQTVQRFGADAVVKVEDLAPEAMNVNINSYSVRLFTPLRILQTDAGNDHYYLVIVWLKNGLEAVFYIWS